jgi:hypothetical protein
MQTDDRATSGRRRLLGGFVAAGVAALLAPTAAEARKKKKRAKPRADARCLGPATNAAFSATSNYRFGQTFTARRTGKLVRAQVMVNTNEGEDADWLVQIVEADLEGRPSDQVLAEARIPNASLADGAVTLTATFPTPASVVVNREYALVLSWTGAGVFSFPTHTDNPCGGRLYVRDLNGAGPYTTTATPRDLVYTTFVKA